MKHPAVARSIKYMQIFTGVPLERGVKYNKCRL